MFKEEESFQSFTCEICLQNVSLNKRFKNSKRCFHHSFCFHCIAKYIKLHTETDNQPDIRCPHSKCDKLLDPVSCRSIVSPTLFKRWCDMSGKSNVLLCQRAYCPYSSCSDLIVNTSEKRVTKSYCPKCYRLFCFHCQRPWHAGYGCDEVDAIRDKNDVLFGFLMEEKKWKRCPNCRQCVERTSGCSKIKCRCGTRFCYECGRKIQCCTCHLRDRNRPETSPMNLPNIVLLYALFAVLALSLILVSHLSKD